MKTLMVSLLVAVNIFAQDGFHDLITIEQNGNGNECIATTEQSQGSNISNIIQDGNYNGTVFDLTGDGVNDPTTITRTAPNCEANIEEHGNYNSAYIQQNFDANTRGTIYQDGNRNLAILKQGYCTVGSLIQEGNLNSIDANQVCSDARLTGTQTGNRNSLTLEQKFDSKLDASQNGNNNEAIIYIDVFASGTSIQDGYGNFLDAMLFSEYNSFYAMQMGNNNYLKIYEDFYSQVDAYQEGNNNHASIIMDNNVITLKQVGNNNYSEQSQTSYSPEGTVCQIGNNNSAYQTRWRNGIGDIQQLSDGNYACQTQQSETWDLDQNYAQIVQTGGMNNYAIQTQTGKGLSSIITQCGSNNRAESYQADVIY